MGLASLTKFSLIYLATPYTKYPAGLEHAFRDACKLTGRLSAAGLHIYSPIAHSHPVAHFGGLNAVDHDFWVWFDKPYLEKCDAMIVAHLEGWDESRGVLHEIGEYGKVGKPVFHINPLTLELIDG